MKKILQIDYETLHLENLSRIEKILFEESKNARLNAYAPYSQFLVGCSVLLENGEIYKGNNQENAAYPSGLCAERSVLYWLGANLPNQKIKKIFIVGGSKENTDMEKVVPPCGSCRQSILEYEIKQNKPIEIYFSSLSGDKVYKIQSIKELLPFTFDSSFL